MQGQAVSVHGDDVEANGSVWCNDLHVIRREPAKRRAFARVHRAERRSETAGRTRLDLHENDGRAFPAHQVYFTARQPDVAPDDPVTRGFQEPGRAIFAGTPLRAVS